MTNFPRTVTAIDPSALQHVYGGRGLVEGGRKLLQAGAVAWNTLFPTHAPIKPPPSPARIERVQPNRQTTSGSSTAGQE
jgi:hypothetical protein